MYVKLGKALWLFSRSQYEESQLGLGPSTNSHQTEWPLVYRRDLKDASIDLTYIVFGYWLSLAFGYVKYQGLTLPVRWRDLMASS